MRGLLDPVLICLSLFTFKHWLPIQCAIQCATQWPESSQTFEVIQNRSLVECSQARLLCFVHKVMTKHQLHYTYNEYNDRQRVEEKSGYSQMYGESSSFVCCNLASSTFPLLAAVNCVFLDFLPFFSLICFLCLLQN